MHRMAKSLPRRGSQRYPPLVPVLGDGSTQLSREHTYGVLTAGAGAIRDIRGHPRGQVCTEAASQFLISQ